MSPRFRRATAAVFALSTFVSAFLLFQVQPLLEITIQTGDARLVLEPEPPQHIDGLVLDTYSGNAVAVHLLTHETLAVNLRRPRRPHPAMD